MNTNGHIRINIPKIVHETIDGETVILNLDKGNYFSLVGIGVDIWGYIESGTSVKGIIERLHYDYDGDRQDIETAVDKFVLELMQEGLTVPEESNTSEAFKCSNDQVISGKKEEGKTAFIAPILNKYTDMQDLLLLDPIHDVDEEKGWPTRNPESQL